MRPLRGEADRAWIVERHGALYAAEEGWDSTFEELVGAVVTDLAARDGSERDAAWIAEVDGRRAGSVACMAKDGQTAKLRLLLVEPWARGQGVGRALVDRCIEFAHDAGYRELELWTTANLTAARRIYEASGFTLVREYAEDRFGAHLVSQDYVRRLG